MDHEVTVKDLPGGRLVFCPGKVREATRQAAVKNICNRGQ